MREWNCSDWKGQGGNRWMVWLMLMEYINVAADSTMQESAGAAPDRTDFLNSNCCYFTSTGSDLECMARQVVQSTIWRCGQLPP